MLLQLNARWNLSQISANENYAIPSTHAILCRFFTVRLFSLVCQIQFLRIVQSLIDADATPLAHF